MANASSSNHETYYVPEQSRLAIFASIALFLLVMGVGESLNGMTFDKEGFHFNFKLIAGFLLLIGTLWGWFSMTIKENRAGLNSAQLKRSYSYGMQWFIFSEVMFFAGFFGALFYVRNLTLPSLAGEGSGAMNTLLWDGYQYSWPMEQTPQQAVGGPANQAIQNNGTFNAPKSEVNWKHIPLINTILLLTSSVTLHFAHVALKASKRKAFNLWLGLTLLLGFVFVGFQAYEYYEAYHVLGLTLESGIYGSTFFMLTGFHGVHVCLGAIMLTVQWLRSTTKSHFTAEDHFGFEASAWYWHFVDVVWIGLFVFVYII